MMADRLRGKKRSVETINKMKKYHQNRTKEHLENIKKSKRNRRSVRCIENGIIFESAWDAAKFCRENVSNGSMIIMQIRGKVLTAYGFHWEYIDD